VGKWNGAFWVFRVFRVLAGGLSCIRAVASGNLLVLLTIGSPECAERTFFIRISIQMALVNAPSLGACKPPFIPFPLPFPDDKMCPRCRKMNFYGLPPFYPCSGTVKYDKQQIAAVIKSKRLNRLLHSGPIYKKECICQNKKWKVFA